MKVSLYNEPFPLLVIEDFYDKNELQLINSELSKLHSDIKDNPFISEFGNNFNKGNSLKKNKSLFLDIYYNNNRESSDILRINRKLFWFLNDIKENIDVGWFFKNVTTEFDNTLISYYTDGDKFNCHPDNATISSLSWFFKQPQRFSGGDLTFSDYEITVKCLYNRMVIFPGMIRHEVSTVCMEEPDSSIDGRWCITQFAHQRKPA